MIPKPDRAAAPDLRTFLVLGRVSNLPTVWSNCLAGWLLGGGGDVWRFLWLSLAATFLYVGGMFLNDAFDADFDRQYRRERPIPSEKIAEASVWRWGLGWLALGAAMLFVFERSTPVLTVLLVGCVLLYDAIHKAVIFSPVVMAGCRFFLFITAASAAEGGVTGLAVWSAFALAAFIIGLSCLARRESARGPVDLWPLGLLAAPVLLALLVNAGGYRTTALWLALALALWSARCLYLTLGSDHRNIGRTISGLLAGIVLTDMLAVLGGTPELAFVFIGLFAAALLFQKFIPAT